MRVRALVVLLSLNTTGLVVAGCAGNASPPPPTSAPKIVSPPVSQTVTSGQSATFSVNATGAPPLSYLQTTNRGFVLSTGSDGGEGSTDGQSAGPFTAASMTGAYFFATTDQPEQNVNDASGVATFDGLGTASATMDSAPIGSSPSSNAFNQSYSFGSSTSTPGRGTITETGVTRYIFYIISKSKFVQMDVMNSDGTPNGNPALVTGRQ